MESNTNATLPKSPAEESSTKKYNANGFNAIVDEKTFEGYMAEYGKLDRRTAFAMFMEVHELSKDAGDLSTARKTLVNMCELKEISLSMGEEEPAGELVDSP